DHDDRGGDGYGRDGRGDDRDRGDDHDHDDAPVLPVSGRSPLRGAVRSRRCHTCRTPVMFKPGSENVQSTLMERTLSSLPCRISTRPCPQAGQTAMK
ncbi:MAG: hypothetical protein KAH56_06520, partial [Candidatus Krumholzibacteria bacterium]|nr:hypothetical protein [Candidatus Krumholzibacteria bacterium]